MTRRDYVLIADVIKSSTVTANLTDVQREDLALAMTKELHRVSGFNGNGNKSFKADVFLAACGGVPAELLSEALAL